MTIPRLTETSIPIAPIRRPMEVTGGELEGYAEPIYRRAGIRVRLPKKTLLSNREWRRLRKTGIDGLAAYYDHLT